jgi:outer membrane protein assembly factor BamB
MNTDRTGKSAGKNPPDDSPQPAARSRWRRRFPGPICWLIIVTCVSLLVLLRRKLIGSGLEQGEVNVLSYILGLIAAGTLIAWVVFFSAFSRRVRLVFLAEVVLVIVLAMCLIRVRQFSGDLVPDFAFRWQPEPDRLLEVPVAASADVDVTTTTDRDYPQFLGPARRATLAAPVLNTDWQANPPRERWRIPIGAGWSSFAIVNGFAVTLEQRGDQELVTCYEAETGTLRWSHGITARHQTAMGGVGPRSTPTIAAGRVYALGATGVLRCLRGTDGGQVWSEDLLARIGVTPDQDLQAVAWGRAASPLVVDNLVVVPLGGPAAGPWKSLAAFDAETGSLVWTGGKHQVSYSSPVLATLQGRRQILIVNQDFVSGHDVATGGQLWEFPWPGNSTMDANVSQVVPLSDSRVFVSKGYYGGATVVEIEAVGDAWQTSVVWENDRALRTKFSNVVVRDDYVLGLSDGILQCADLATGDRLWRAGRYNQGQILGVAGPPPTVDLLLVQAESGDVILLSTDRDGQQELGRIAALDGKTWNNPALYGPLLLVRNGQQAACYELRIAGE